MGTYDLSISGCSAAGCPGDTDGDSIGGATTFTGCGATFINTTTSDASVKISLWNRDGDNSNPAQRSFLLKAEQMADVADVLFSLFGESAGAAALHLAVEPGIIADGRTYNLVKEGTYGQYIPGLGEGSAVTAHRKGYLVMPVQNTGFRSNLGLVNPSDQPVDVRVRLYNAAGNQVGANRSWSLDPREVKQIDRIMKQFTSQNMDAGSLAREGNFYCLLALCREMQISPVRPLLPPQP